MITWENYEEYLIMYIDGELNKQQEQELMSFMYAHPELQQELAAFSMTKMIPDEADTYINKEALLREEEPARVIAFGGWRTYRVAAGIAAAILLGVGAIWMQQERMGEQPQLVAQTNIAQDQSESTVAEVRTGGNNNSERAGVEEESRIVAPTADRSAIAAANTNVPVMARTQNNGRKNRKIVLPVSSNDAADMAVAAREQIAITPLAVATQLMNNKMPEIEVVAVTNVPAVAIYTLEERRSLIDRLPIDELKKKGMESFASALADGYEKVNTLRDEVYSAQVSMKVEKRKLIVSF